MPDPSLPAPLLGLAPWVRLVHDFRTMPGYRLTNRRIVDHALLFFLGGAGTYRCEGRQWRIEPGCLAIVRPGRMHTISADPGVPLHLCNIHFDLRPRSDSPQVRWNPPGPARILGPQERLPDDPALPGHLPPYLSVARPELYHEWFRMALHSVHAPGVTAALRTSATVILLLAELYRQTAEPDADRKDQQGIERAVATMHDRLGHDWSVAELSGLAGLGRTRFCERFSQRFGVPPMTYLRQLRLESARQDLIHGQAPVKEVAQRYGFASVHHFTRAFAAAFGQPPARLRAQGDADAQARFRI